MILFNDLTIFTEYLIPSIFVIYLYNKRTGKLNQVFSLIHLLLLSAIPIFTALFLLDLNPFTLFKYTWTSWTTPVQYIFFMILIYYSSYNKEKDKPYSITMSLHMALFCGYMYEIPRYLYLQGLNGLIRFNRQSPFLIHYGIISGFVILWMLRDKKLNYGFGLLFSVALYTVYVIDYVSFHTLVYNNFVFLGFYFPRINILRFPSMMVLYFLVNDIWVNYPHRYKKILTCPQCIAEKNK